MGRFYAARQTCAQRRDWQERGTCAHWNPRTANRTIMPKTLRWTLLCLSLLGLLLASGPRVPVEAPPAQPALPADLDAYLAQSEARFSDLVTGTQKQIIWAHADRRQTDLALVYLHGFSASRQETAPLSEDLARQLGANLFVTRLSGHGRSPQAMGEPSVRDWLQDAQEALAIGQRLGKRVIVLGVSTGGTLGTWLANRQPDLAALVLISPNFAPRDPMARLLTWPWAQQVLPWVLPAEHVWKPRNPEQARYWNHHYPTQALFPMMALVQHVNDLPLQDIRVPTLMIYSPNDQVVSAEAAEAAFARLGSSHKQLIARPDSQDPSHHVLAGRILAPDDTAAIQAQIAAFVQQLPTP